MKTTGNTILITGGGSGIGQALAYRFHDLGNTVIVVGRRMDTLGQATAGRPRMHAMILDIEDAASIAPFGREVVAAHPELNVLINNAGIMRFEALDRSRDLSDAEVTVATNLLGPIRLTDALIEHLCGRPDAALVNVSSGLAFVPLTATPTYCATKAAIHSYTVAARDPGGACRVPAQRRGGAPLRRGGDNPQRDGAKGARRANLTGADHSRTRSNSWRTFMKVRG